MTESDGSIVGTVVDDAGAAHGLLQRLSHLRVQLRQRGVQGLARDADALQRHAVEPLRVVDERRRAAMPDVLTDRPHLLQGGLDVQLGSGQQITVESAVGKDGGTAQVDSGNHGSSLSDGVRPPAARISE